MTISEIIDCNRLANHTTPRQNPKTNNLVLNTLEGAELEVFEVISRKDRAGRRQGSLNVKALKPWEIHQIDGDDDGVGAGHPRAINAMKFSDTTTYITDSISSVSEDFTIISLTQAVDSIHKEGLSLADSGGQCIFQAGDETEVSTYLKVLYKSIPQSNSN